MPRLFPGRPKRAGCSVGAQNRRQGGGPQVEVEVALAAQARNLLGRLQQQQAHAAAPLPGRDRHVAQVRALLRRLQKGVGLRPKGCFRDACQVCDRMQTAGADGLHGSGMQHAPAIVDGNL